MISTDVYQFFSMASPISTQSGTELQSKLMRTDFFNVLIEYSPEGADESGPDRLHGIHGFGNIGHHVLRTGRPLDIGKERDPSSALESPSQFSGNAGLAHAPLPGQ